MATQSRKPEQISVCESTLEALSHRAAVPHYDRRALGRGIVHIGAGGFNRAHLATYLDDLLNQGGDPRWSECGIGLLPGDERIHTALAAQDHLYSVLARDDRQQDLRIVGALSEHLFAPKQSETVLERMSASECGIVSLTVTEGGYFIEEASKKFLETHSSIQHDLANPSRPITFLGYLAEAAARRMKQGIAPFTVMSCDNVQGNGDTTRKALLAFAGIRDPRLRKWIEENVAFPNSMVDRITPVTTEADKEFIARRFGVRDLSPVVPEPFRQWVIEDTFCNGRPLWETVGAQLTTDVAPFERVKMRLLNGGHSTIAYIAALLGINHVYEAMADEQIRALEVMFLDEVTPVLPELRGMELTGYKASLIHRFSNPSLPDQIMRIASEGAAKLAKFIVPTIGDLREMGKKPRIIPLVIAAWLYAMCGKDEAGRPLAIVDASASLLDEFVKRGGKDVKPALSIGSVFGDLAIADGVCAAQIQHDLDSLRSIGVRATIQRVLDKTC